MLSGGAEVFVGGGRLMARLLTIPVPFPRAAARAG